MSIKRFTLDTNCIVDVEEARPSAQYIVALLHLARSGAIDLAISAISASEKQKSGGYAANFTEFQAKLAKAGFEGVELLKPIVYMDVCFWDWSVYPTDEDLVLEEAIHRVLFPNMAYAWPAYAAAGSIDVNSIDKKWKNAKCDVLALWTHIKNMRDVFVTSDLNFQAPAKLEALLSLGAGAIATPERALELAVEGGLQS